MKKKVIIVAVIVAVLVAAILFIRSASTEETPVVDGQPVTVNIEPDTTKKQSPASYNKKVTVTLPAEIIDEKYNGDLDAYAEANGFDSVKLTKDGQVKIKMRAFSYDLILANIGLDAIDNIGHALDSGNFPYFLDLAKYSRDFSSIIIAVDKEGYEKAENREALLTYIAVACLNYQSYDVDSEGKCEITVCEEGTNLLIETREFTIEDLENIE